MQIKNNKGDVYECGNYKGIKLMSHTISVGESKREKVKKRINYDKKTVWIYARKINNALPTTLLSVRKCSRGVR